jgi:hypothetical protein
MNMVVLASPRRDPIWSKRHNGRCLRALYMYSTMTTPPPRSSKARWSGRWDQQHDGVVLMVESICGQGFAYACEVEEDRQKSSQTRARKYYKRQRWRRLKQFSVLGQKPNSVRPLPFIHKQACEPSRTWSLLRVHVAYRETLHSKDLGRSAKLPS